MKDDTTHRGNDGKATVPPDPAPMTSTQATYLRELSELAGVPFEPYLSQAEAAGRIETLQRETGRAPKEILSSDQTDG
jgi:hypothetical protein